jgi:hypothetical protein
MADAVSREEVLGWADSGAGLLVDLGSIADYSEASVVGLDRAIDNAPNPSRE